MSIELVLGLDLETTGLDPTLDGILEIGLQVIAPDFSTVASVTWLVKQSRAILDRMSTAVRAQHERSGLLRACEERGVPQEDAFNEAVKTTRFHFPEGKAILLGASIHFDRGFIKAQIPDLEKLLHYRMIDSSSIREAVRIFGSEHRTQADIANSARTVREFVERLK